jgi:hypothetical protein
MSSNTYNFFHVNIFNGTDSRPSPNNIRSNEILREEIIKAFPRTAHIKWKHKKACSTRSIKTHVTENGTS